MTNTPTPPMEVANRTVEMHPLDLRRIPRNLPSDQYKRGDEFRPFHPQASHVPPEYRDGWNRCWLAAALASTQAEPVTQAEAMWRCFHCDETFRDEDAAREHFGPTLISEPACQIDIAEYRRMQEAHRRQCEEDTDWHRAYYRLGSDHRAAMNKHGDAEYARGLRDGVNLPPDSPERAALASPPSAVSVQGQGERPAGTGGVETCPESGNHCKPVGGECQTCGATGVQEQP